MIVKNEDAGQWQINCDSSSTQDGSPLRSFLRSMQSVDEQRGTIENNVTSINPGLFTITPSSSSRNGMASYDRGNNEMCIESGNQCALSVSLDKMDLDGETNDRNAPGGFKDPDVFVQNSNWQQQSLMNQAPPSIPKKMISDWSQKKKERQLKGNLDVQSKKEEISYYTLNKLMERSASSRCLLLQQTKKSNKSSDPLLKSLSASAFKTIVSSTNITTSISASSFRKNTNTNTRVSDKFTSSDCINSTFDGTTAYSEQQPKKPRMISAFDVGLFDTNLQPPKARKEVKQTRVKPKRGSLANSLPSCGSLESSSSGSDCNIRQVTDKSSSTVPFEISAPIEASPVICGKDVMYPGTAQLSQRSVGMSSCQSLVSSSSVGPEEDSFEQMIHALSSPSGRGARGSPRMKRKFNSFQVPTGRNDRSVHLPNRGFSCGGDLRSMQQHHRRRNSRKNKDKISQEMKLQLRRELQRPSSKTGYQKCSNSTWLF